MDGHQEHQNYIDPHYNMMTDMAQHQQQQHPQMQQYYHQPQQQSMLQQQQPANPLPVNFTTFTPDPNVMAFQGQPYPPQLTMLSQNPMPLLPTEPIPQTSLKAEKKKTPTKAGKKKESSSPGAPGQVPFKKIPEYVQKLMQKRHPGFQDREFAERALSNLARKLASQAAVLDEWVRAVEEADSFSGCVCVIRPKDGRMTITKATGNAGCKKVFPQIFVCQLFRWPQIVFHHDIKSSSHCMHPRVIKPSTSDTKEELICVNPFHYDLNTEVDPNRTKKQSKPNKSQFPMTSCQDNNSDEDILAYEDDGVDYIKLWDEKSIKPKSADKKAFITFENLMKELKFFTLQHESKKLIPTEAAEKNLTEEIKTFLLSGKYKSLIENMPVKPQVMIAKDRDLMPPPTRLGSSSVQSPNTKVNSATPTIVEEEDSAIQNLLDDIRGSFERQFDDEFNDLHAEEGSRSSSPFGNINIGTTFSMSDGHDALEDLASVSAEDILAASSPDEMPLEGWTMSQEVFDNFLEAASHSGDGNNAGAGGENNSADQFNFNNQQLHHDSNQHF